jgi:hypothetical protein
MPQNAARDLDVLADKFRDWQGAQTQSSIQDHSLV